jgi:hypothetical protein
MLPIVLSCPVLQTWTPVVPQTKDEADFDQILCELDALDRDRRPLLRSTKVSLLRTEYPYPAAGHVALQ